MSNHPYVDLARKSIEYYLKTGKPLKSPSELSDDFKIKAGVFVSLKKKGLLRGCIGTFMPTRDNIFEEIVINAISASQEDPRFPKVNPDELSEIDISVDVLSEPMMVNDISELDPKKFGVIVSKGYKRGLLLPDIEGVNTVQEQLRITKMKAGINPDDNDTELYKFTVKRYK